VKVDEIHKLLFAIESFDEVYEAMKEAEKRFTVSPKSVWRGRPRPRGRLYSVAPKPHPVPQAVRQNRSKPATELIPPGLAYRAEDSETPARLRASTIWPADNTAHAWLWRLRQEIGEMYKMLY